MTIDSTVRTRVFRNAVDAGGQPDPTTKEALTGTLGELRFSDLTKHKLTSPLSTIKLFLTEPSIEDLWILLAWGR
jgi:hypothetical protein